MHSVPKALRRLALYAAAVVVFGLTLEICARLDDLIRYRAPFFESYGSNRLRGEDEDGIRRNLPGGRYEKWSNNSLGFRGPEIALEPGPGVRRIVCLGASETYGLYESPHQEWPAQLADRVPASTEVVNAATVGLRRKDVLRYWNKYVARLEPHVVIVLPGPVTVRSLPGTPPADAGHADRRGFLERVSLRPRLKSKAVQVVKGFLPRSWLESYQDRDRRRKLERAERAVLKGEEPLEDFAEASVEDFRQDWRNVVEAVRATGARVILGSTPTLLRPENLESHELVFMEARRQNVKLSYRGLIRSYELSREIMGELASEYGLEFVDLYGSIPPDGEHFRDAVHFSDRGARLVAEAFAAELASDPVAEASTDQREDL